MKNHHRLFEFLIQLTDIQIKKYSDLVNIGIGPDAGMNAKLVLDQVEELLQFANTLLNDLENIWIDSKIADQNFLAVFKQVQFYLEMEYLRGHAGWLIDENNIHTPEMKRLNQQKEAIFSIGSAANVSLISPFPLTQTQLQCLHDSHAISFLILDMVVKLKQNPELEFDNGFPHHAKNILRKHVMSPSGRYHQDQYWNPIQELHKKCSIFLENSPLTKSNALLTREIVTAKVSEHSELLKGYLARFAKIKPDSMLFSSEGQWYAIGNKQKQPLVKFKPQSSSNHVRLFGMTAVVAICAMIYYLVNQSTESVSPSIHW